MAMNLSVPKPVVVQLKQTCDVAPAQWEGRTDGDRPVYIKGRHGVLSVRIGPAGGSISEAVRGEELIRIPHKEADALSSEDIMSMLADLLDFSKLREVTPFTEGAV